MEVLLFFNFRSKISENILRLIIVILSGFDFILISVHFIQNFIISDIFSIILLIFVFLFLFPRVTNISTLSITNDVVKVEKWYTNSFIRKLKIFSKNSRSLNLQNLDKLEIQHLGIFSTFGRINFIFKEGKNLSLQFTTTEITSKEFQNFKLLNPEKKIINTDTANNLAVLADHFSYGYNSLEFIQNQGKSYYFIIFIIILILLLFFTYLDLFI